MSLMYRHRADTADTKYGCYETAVVTANVSLLHSQRKTEARKWVSIIVTPLSSANEDLVNNPRITFFRFRTN